jgi:type VI secretion system protein VasD
VKGSVAAGANANPDGRGRPSPIVVRVFELKATSAFESADFFAIFDKEQETLAGEVVWRQEFQVRPGQIQTYQRTRQPEVKFVGAIAAFRDLENSRWRSTAPIPTKKIPFTKELSVTVGVEAHAVTVAVK